jgi:hydroxymethylpyrimidine pyrophosphatase-like HAD family hydrolase
MNPGIGAPSAIRPTVPDKPFLLGADIDGTLLGDEEGELSLKAFVQDHPDSCCLVVVTGRPLPSVQQLVRETRLPRPDYIGSSVGTELLACGDATNALGRKYAVRVSNEWSLERIYSLGEGEGVRRQDFTGGQPRFQAGFYWDGQPGTLAAFCMRLAEQPGCHILPSSGMFIDVLPNNIGKGELVRFLQRELGIGRDRVVVAGDSGNDRELFETGFQGVIPVNALEELKAVACQPWHYQSPLPAGRGVMDGLCHFGLVERPCCGKVAGP